MTYAKTQITVPTNPFACGGTGSSVKMCENLSQPIPTIGLGKQQHHLGNNGNTLHTTRLEQLFL